MAVNITGITDTQVSAAVADQISHNKVKHESHSQLSQTGTTVAATQYIMGARQAGTLRSIRAIITETVISAGSDRTLTIDLQKSTGGAAFATVLTAVISFSESDTTVRTWKSGTFSNASFSADDCFKFVVALTGSTGTAALGLLVTLIADMAPSTS